MWQIYGGMVFYLVLDNASTHLRYSVFMTCLHINHVKLKEMFFFFQQLIHSNCIHLAVLLHDRLLEVILVECSGRKDVNIPSSRHSFRNHEITIISSVLKRCIHCFNTFNLYILYMSHNCLPHLPTLPWCEGNWLWIQMLKIHSSRIWYSWRSWAGQNSITVRLAASFANSVPSQRVLLRNTERTSFWCCLNVWEVPKQTVCLLPHPHGRVQTDTWTQGDRMTNWAHWHLHICIIYWIKRKYIFNTRALKSFKLIKVIVFIINLFNCLK